MKAEGAAPGRQALLSCWPTGEDCQPREVALPHLCRLLPQGVLIVVLKTLELGICSCFHRRVS